MKVIRILFALILFLAASYDSYAGCFDYTEGAAEEVPLYEICDPSGKCVQAKLESECSSQYLSLQIFENGIAWYATQNPDEYRVEVQDGVLCRGTDCDGWSFTEIGRVPFVGDEAGNSFDYKNCTAEKTNSMVRYYAHGKAAQGHEFGFIRKGTTKDEDVLWISWSTSSTDLDEYKGKNIELHLSIEGIECEIAVPFVYCDKLGSLTVFVLTDVAGHRFVDLIEASRDVTVTIVGPSDFVKKCDINEDTFDLSGLSEAQSKADELLSLSTSSLKNSKSFSLSQRQMEIIQTAMSAFGYLTKKMHSEFWEIAPEVRDELLKSNEFKSFVKERMVLVGNFQRECWASVKASLEAGKVIINPEFQLQVQKLQTSGLPPEQVQRAIENAEQLFKAAAGGTAFQSPNGPVVLTHKEVNRIWDKLGESIERAECLMNPEWNGGVPQFRYATAHIASDYRLKESWDNDHSIRLMWFGENGGRIVVYYFKNMRSFVSDYELFKSCTEVIFSEMIIQPDVELQNWRGCKSATCNTTKYRLTKPNTHYSLRLVEIPDTGGVLAFYASGEDSISMSEDLRQMFEEHTGLISQRNLGRE